MKILHHLLILKLLQNLKKIILLNSVLKNVGNEKFPIDTPLVLRLVKTHMGKCLFSPELKSYLITQ